MRRLLIRNRPGTGRLLPAACALLLAASLALVAGCSTGSGRQAAQPRPHGGVTGDPPLPPGDWVSVYKGKQDLAQGESERAIYAGVTHSVIERLVLLYRVRLGRRYEFLPRSSCSSPDYYFQEARDIREDSGACWHVRAVNLGLAGDPHWVNIALASFAEARDLYLPTVMVGARFIRYHEGELLQVDYLWNPDILLPQPGRVWVPDDWGNAAVGQAPEKRVVMEVIRRWGEEWQPKIEAVFPF